MHLSHVLISEVNFSLLFFFLCFVFLAKTQLPEWQSRGHWLSSPLLMHDSCWEHKQEKKGRNIKEVGSGTALKHSTRAVWLCELMPLLRVLLTRLKKYSNLTQIPRHNRSFLFYFQAKFQVFNFFSYNFFRTCFESPRWSLHCTQWAEPLCSNTKRVQTVRSQRARNNMKNWTTTTKQELTQHFGVTQTQPKTRAAWESWDFSVISKSSSQKKKQASCNVKRMQWVSKTRCFLI